MLRDSSTDYGLISQAFHWALTLLVIGMLLLGWAMAAWFPHASVGPTLGYIHKATGLLTIALAILFVAWRVLNTRPSLAEIPAWQRTLASLTHVLLFLILFVQPLTGILMVMASGHAISFYGLFSLPVWTPHSHALASTAHFIHTEILPWVILGAIVMHVLGAFYHQLVRRDDILQRMLPGRGVD